MKRRTASLSALISFTILFCSGCASTKNNSAETSSISLTNTEIISVGSGVATAWLINPIAGVVVGVGSYYFLEEGE